MVEEAEYHAKQDSELDVDELYSKVYSQPPKNFKIRGCDNFTYKQIT